MTKKYTTKEPGKTEDIDRKDLTGTMKEQRNADRLSHTRRQEALIAQIEELLAQEQEECDFYLMSMDISEFKQINYHYGFEAGNRLLADLEQFICDIPQCVLCERAGGDRFFFLTRHEEKQTKEAMLASFDFWWNKFRSTKQQTFPICPLKAWCGIYRVTKDSIQFAIENADLARQKVRQLRGAAAMYCEESLVAEVSAQKEQEYRILEALEANRFTFWLQPQVDIRSGKILSAEALARGTYDTGEMIAPAVFIPILEKNGAITRLDLLILRQVCQNLRERLDQGEPVVPISVNLSRIDLRNEDLVAEIDHIVSAHGISHEYLVFELTESVVMDSFLAAQNVLDQLSRLGYKISIDDFGSGYAGIDVCRKMCFDELKMDKSLVDELGGKNNKAQIILEGICSIMENLGVRVVCEGVETAEQCHHILEIGCHIVQGFYFSKPLPYADFYQKYDSDGGYYPIDF